MTLCRPKAVVKPPKPKRPPIDAVAISRRAWRREVEAASALVNSSKLDDCIWIGSFQAKPEADPGANAASEAAPAFVYRVSQQELPPNVKPKCHDLRM